MVTIKEVKTKKEIKEFITFPLNLYKDNPYFVPPLYMDEKKLFKKDNPYKDSCEAVYFNAYRDGKIVGRISGIIQRDANKKNNEKRARFTRFDSIDDQEVSNALFSAVEKWAISKGMDTVCGPLGFSDLEREGLLIEGFDQLSTFEEQYNYDYYQKLIENFGYEKEVDWTEHKINVPDNDDGSLEKLSEYVLKRYNLHMGEAKNINEFIDKYVDGFFDIIDSSYDKLYGTVPFTDAMKKELISNFRLIVSVKHVAVVLNEDEKIVCFGLCFPSIGKAVQKSGGRLTPLTLIKLLKTIKKPEILDLGLIGVDPAYLNTGINAVMAAGLMRMLKENKFTHAETNLNLENNHSIQNMWKRFKETQHKRRRAFVKKLV